MARLPEYSNFFCALHTNLSPSGIGALYEPLGWRVRKCSWVDYEVTSDWAELVIEDILPVLMHGPVADLLDRAEGLVGPLRAAGVSFTAECYGPEPDRELLLELRS
jgi:hypothetical protein